MGSGKLDLGIEAVAVWTVRGSPSSESMAYPACAAHGNYKVEATYSGGGARGVLWSWGRCLLKGDVMMWSSWLRTQDVPLENEAESTSPVTCQSPLPVPSAPWWHVCCHHLEALSLPETSAL